MRIGALLFILGLVSAVSSLTDEAVIGAVVNMKDAVASQMDWSQANVSKVHTDDVQVGDGFVYDVEIEIKGVTLPLTFAEEVLDWKYMSLPPQESDLSELPRLSPFQLVGPVELRLENATNLRLAVPNEVDAGTLDKVLLAEGATVTISGAREVSLSKPIKLQLPLEDGNSLMSMTEKLKDAARSKTKPVISFRVVQPDSLIASAPPAALPGDRLKVRKTSPGAVEITKQPTSTSSSVEVYSDEDWVWPLPSVKSTDSKVMAIQQTLKMLLGPAANMKGSLNVLKARATRARFVKVEFELTREIDESMFPEWPVWQTRPSSQRKQFELLARVDGDKVIPQSVTLLYPDLPEPTPLGWSGATVVLNNTMSFKTSPFFFPSSPLTL